MPKGEDQPAGLLEKHTAPQSSNPQLGRVRRNNTLSSGRQLANSKHRRSSFNIDETPYQAAQSSSTTEIIDMIEDEMPPELLLD
jgi:N-acetyl-anhydromuramyl-L-alanine amidase AmpD